MDDIDRAQDREQLDRELAVHAVLSRMRASPAPSTDCARCGDAIDPRRLAAYPAAHRCVRCQQIFERTGVSS